MRTRFAALLLLAALSPGVYAHSDEYFDRRPSPHGGQVRMAGPVHLELVVNGDEVVVYVTDHTDNPVNTDNGSAKVIMRSGKKNRFVVVLRPAGDNVLRGAGEFKLGKKNDVTLLVTLPGQDPQRAQFRIGKDGKPIALPERRAGSTDR
jgi:nitrogen fixation protein FixH